MPKTKEPELVRVNFTAPEDLIERVEQFAKERLEDRSTAIRQLIQEGLKAVLAAKVVKQYQQGAVTLREAADQLGIDIWELHDLLLAHGVPTSSGALLEPDVKLLRQKARKLIRP